ncbi:MAG: hypothetical protein V8T00_05695 [Oscillospiraceae bacterium]
MSEQEFLSGFCPKCGESLKVPAKLSQFSCMYCGARLTADELLDKPAGSGSIAPEEALLRWMRQKSSCPAACEASGAIRRKLRRANLRLRFLTSMR